MAKNRWLSIDAHFHYGAGRVLQSVLPIKAGRDYFMTNYSYRRCDSPRYMTKNRWCSIDIHLHNGAGRVLLSVLPIHGSKNTFMTEYNLSEVWFPRRHDQKLLTLHWRSFSWWGWEGIAICFAYKGRQKLLYDLLQPIGGVISQDTWPKIVDAPLTLIFIMGQGGYCNLFCL